MRFGPPTRARRAVKHRQHKRRPQAANRNSNFQIAPYVAELTRAHVPPLTLKAFKMVIRTLARDSTKKIC